MSCNSIAKRKNFSISSCVLCSDDQQSITVMGKNLPFHKDVTLSLASWFEMEKHAWTGLRNNPLIRRNNPLVFLLSIDLLALKWKQAWTGLRNNPLINKEYSSHDQLVVVFSINPIIILFSCESSS